MATRRRAKHPSIHKVSGDPKINWMLFAHPGIGKTTLIGTGPDKTLIIRPPLDSVDPVRRANPRMDEWVITGWNDMIEALQWLRDEKGAGYEWVWLDSISLVQDTTLDDIWDDVIKKKPARAEYGLDRAEYGVNMFRLGQWVRHAVGAGHFHLGMTAHPALLPNPDKDDDEEEDRPDEILMPWVQGKQMAVKMCGYCNLVTYLKVKKVRAKDGTNVNRRVLYTDANQVFYAKNSLSPVPNGRMINPTIPKVMQYVLGTQNEESS